MTLANEEIVKLYIYAYQLAGSTIHSFIALLFCLIPHYIVVVLSFCNDMWLNKILSCCELVFTLFICP